MSLHPHILFISHKAYTEIYEFYHPGIIPRIILLKSDGKITRSFICILKPPLLSFAWGRVSIHNGLLWPIHIIGIWRLD